MIFLAGFTVGAALLSGGWRWFRRQPMRCNVGAGATRSAGYRQQDCVGVCRDAKGWVQVRAFPMASKLAHLFRCGPDRGCYGHDYNTDRGWADRDWQSYHEKRAWKYHGQRSEKFYPPENVDGLTADELREALAEIDATVKGKATA